MKLTTLVLSIFLTAASSRSPFSRSCFEPFYPGNRCMRKTSLDLSLKDYVTRDLSYVNPNIVDLVCRLTNHYGLCLRDTFVGDQCPIELVTAKDIILGTIFSVCDVYKEDIKNVFRCFNDDKKVHDDTINCLKKISFDDAPDQEKCSYMYDSFYNCIKLVKSCKTYNVGSFLKYLKEEKSKVCYIMNIAFSDYFN